MGSDILTEISPDKFSEVLETLKKDWPQSIHIYYLIKNFMRWLGKTDEIEFKVYCPENNTQVGVVVAETIYKEGPHYIMFHCIDEAGLIKLKKILRETSVIDWTKTFLVEASHEKLDPLLEAIFKEKQLDYVKRVFQQLWLPPEKSKNIILEDLPSDGIELRDLEERHFDIINRTWAYRDSKSESVVRASVVLNGGVGLFLKGSDSPIAWTTIVQFYGLGMLHTLDDYRQKGYGSIVTKALSKRLAEAGIDPYVSVKDDNVASLSMFTKLGFEKICIVHWGDLQPKTVSKE